MSSRLTPLFGLVLVTAVSRAASGQVSLPNVRMDGPIVTREGKAVTLPTSPMHAQFRIKRFETSRLVAYTLLDSIPRDSLRRAVAAFAAPQVDAVNMVKGVRHHPAGLVALKAEQDPVGRGHFQSWVATSGLSVSDRLSAFLAQFEANADPERPSRLPEAEAMLRAIEALGPQYRPYVVDGHGTLTDVYYALGVRDSVISHAEQTLHLILSARTGYGARMMQLINQFALQKLVQAYAGLPDGVQRIDRVMARLRAASVLTPEERATMSEVGAKRSESRFQPLMERKLAQVRMVGQPGAGLAAHAWLNAGTETRQAAPTTQSFADGKIRILEFGTTGCGPCKEALRPLGSLREAYRAKGVEVVYVTQTTGNWNTQIVTPEDEVAKLKEFYVERLQVKFPIAVWAGDKRPAPEDGMLPEPSPNDSSYNVGGTPHFVVLDGRGRIRYVRSGADYQQDSHFDIELRRVVDFILADGQRDAAPHRALPLWQSSSAGR